MRCESSDARLKSSKILKQLFAEGRSISIYPIRVIYLPLERSAERPQVAHVAFSVGKRRFPKAVQRNRIKRQMREAYRLQKQGLIDAISHQPQSALALILLYIGKEPLPYERIHSAVGRALKKLAGLDWPIPADGQPNQEKG